MNDIYDLLCLLSVPGVGSQSVQKLINQFGSPQAALQADVSAIARVGGFTEDRAKTYKEKIDKRFADDQIARAEKNSIRLIAIWDSDYPEILKKIHDPPVLLYTKGSLNGEDENQIAVVGTRTPTQYGRWAAERIGEELAGYGYGVVSGMARGIDSYAHRGALKGGGKTIAVLGCGVDIVYPPENDKLYGQIAKNGVVVSEFPITTPPESRNFPRRNRIISGLSMGTVVVEAGKRSGALITAHIALEQGRDVFAVPGSIRSVRSRGTHTLIKEGAKLIEGVEDILSEMPNWKGERDKDGVSRIDISKRLSGDERNLWDVLSENPIHIDQIAANAKITTSEALAMLLSMELKNCVKQLSGMMFVRL